MAVAFSEYLDHIEQDALTLAGLSPRASAQPVPSCPGWQVTDLLAHCCNVLLQKVPLLQARSLEPPDGGSWTRAKPGDADLPTLLNETARKILTELRSIGPDVPLWSWYAPDHSSYFWARRLAHELTIHRVDLELSLQRTGTCQPLLAADGVGEVLEVFLARPGRPITDSGPEAMVQIRGTDLPCSWSVRMTAAGSLVSAAAAERPDATISGQVQALYLWLWGRSGPEQLEVDGPVALRDRLRGLLALAT
jgi:uncharacterized protein (TIGR03083 family)